MQMYGGVEALLYIFLTWNYIEVSGQLHALAALPPQKEFPAPSAQEAGLALELV
jgi:hypothetical protein